MHASHGPGPRAWRIAWPWTRGACFHVAPRPLPTAASCVLWGGCCYGSLATFGRNKLHSHNQHAVWRLEVPSLCELYVMCVTETEQLSSLPLQVGMHLNAWYTPCWLIAVVAVTSKQVKLRHGPSTCQHHRGTTGGVLCREHRSSDVCGGVRARGAQALHGARR